MNYTGLDGWEKGLVEIYYVLSTIFTVLSNSHLCLRNRVREYEQYNPVLTSRTFHPSSLRISCSWHMYLLLLHLTSLEALLLEAASPETHSFKPFSVFMDHFKSYFLIEIGTNYLILRMMNSTLLCNSTSILISFCGYLSLPLPTFSFFLSTYIKG